MQTVTTPDSDMLRDPDREQPKADAIKTSDHFVFRLQGRAYAVAPSSVESVAQMQRVVPVPTAGAHVQGIIHSRGRIIAVIAKSAATTTTDHQYSRGGEPGSHGSRISVLIGPSAAFVAEGETTGDRRHGMLAPCQSCETSSSSRSVPPVTPSSCAGFERS